MCFVKGDYEVYFELVKLVYMVFEFYLDVYECIINFNSMVEESIKVEI